MYSKMKFKNDIFADIFYREVVAYCYSYGEMEHVCVKKYENDDELVEVLKFISKLVNQDNHREALDALFSVANEFKAEVSYDSLGVAKLNVEHIVGNDYDAFIDRLKDEFLKYGIDGDVSVEVHDTIEYGDSWEFCEPWAEVIDNGIVIAII